MSCNVVIKCCISHYFSNWTDTRVPQNGFLVLFIIKKLITKIANYNYPWNLYFSCKLVFFYAVWLKSLKSEFYTMTSDDCGLIGYNNSFVVCCCSHDGNLLVIYSLRPDGNSLLCMCVLSIDVGRMSASRACQTRQYQLATDVSQ